MAAALLAADNGYNLFQRGLAKERADADPRGAIRIYEQVLQDKSIDRKLAAQALLRMAECHQKLGDAEARKIYERLVREYPDQTDQAAVARKRLGVRNTSHVATTRQVWTGPKVDTFGTVSPDGRFISYADWSTGNLALHDIESGTDRNLTAKGSWNNSPDWTEDSAISRDGKQVAFGWWTKGRFRLRIANLAGEPNVRDVYDNEDTPNLEPRDWTPDGQWIAVQITRKDLTRQIGLVSVGDGTLRVLKSLDWRGTTRLAFSPDGKLLAFDLPAGADTEQRDIFVLATDGSREIPIAVHPADDQVAGWSPDGSRVLFTSDRSSSSGLWAASLDTKGPPEFLKPDVPRDHIGVTKAGAIYYAVDVGTRDILEASIDISSGRVTREPAFVTTTNLGKNTWPVWSHDGKRIAWFTSKDPRARRAALTVKDRASGRLSTFEIPLNYPYFPRWVPGSEAIAFRAADDKGRLGVHRIDTRTGTVSLLPHATGNLIPAGWSPDGRKLYAQRPDGARQELVTIELDLSTGAERELLRRKAGAPALVSPDGKQLTYVARNPEAKTLAIMIVPISGGQPKGLVQLDTSHGPMTVLEWTPDSSTVLFKQVNSQDLRAIEVGSGRQRAMPLTGPNLELLSQFVIHPDGRSIAFLGGEARREIWALENLLVAKHAK
jgi:Tol biopolymer transport system component